MHRRALHDAVNSGDETSPSRSKSMKESWPRSLLTIGLCGAVSLPLMHVSAQAPRHLNPMIAKLSSGGAAISGQDWQFIDLEHNPLDMTKLDAQIDAIMNEKGP